MTIKINKKQTWTMGKFMKQAWETADLQHFGKPISYDNNTYYLTIHDSQKKIQGALVCKESAGVIRVSELIIAPDHQRQGLGKQLMLKVEKLAKQHEVHKIYLETGKDWEAVKFYQSLGYQITGQHPKHHFKQDFVVFSKFL
ncbi:MAG: GNAT family N-acetyltransferase [bacterium]|nr:GNAT family N-acetyltransferase [bacterium]